MKQKTYTLSPEILELAQQIALKLYGKKDYNLKAIVEYCLSQEQQKMNK